MAARAKLNPKAYFKCVQHKKALRKNIPVLKTGDVTVVDSEGKADLLMKHFQSVYRKDSEVPFPPLDIGALAVADMQQVNIVERDVSKSLSYLSFDKAAGPDGVHPAIVKPLASLVARPLTQLFNQSLQDGEILDDWRTAHVVAIHKGGAKESVKQYRPVSLTSIILKTMERIIRDRVAQHLTENNLLCPQQHGFVKRRSCLTNLISFLDAVTTALDQGKKVAVCYFDFSKAFDSVNHRLLLYKLERYKVASNICGWIAAFLKDRVFRVKVGEAVSEEALAYSGVPQGSVLGPLLFIIYINDLVAKLKGQSFFYADDLKVLHSDRTDTLDHDLPIILEWSQTWDMPLNAEKCVLLANSDFPPDLPVLRTSSGDMEMKRVQDTRDLGVIMRNDFKPTGQCHNAAVKGRRALFQLKGSIRSRSAKVFLPLYKSMVRPHLEYCVQAWCPYYKKDKDEIERVQRMATRWIKECKGMSYEARLQYLGLFSMERRRLRGDLIEVFKIFKGMTDLKVEDLFEIQGTQRGRGHKYKLGKVRPRLDIRAHFFALRVVNPWNSLPDDVVAANSIEGFKFKLDRVWPRLFPEIK